MLATVAIREEIRQTLKEKGISMYRFAKMCEEEGEPMKPRHLSEFINGDRNFTANKLEAMAKVLGKKWSLTD